MYGWSYGVIVGSAFAVVFGAFLPWSQGHFFFLLFAYRILVGLASCQRLKSSWWVIIFFAVSLFELTVFFRLLLLQHFCDLIEKLINALASLSWNGIVGHLILLDQMLQLFLFEVSAWEYHYRSRSVLFPQIIDKALSFLFSRNKEIHCSKLAKDTGAS